MHILDVVGNPGNESTDRVLGKKRHGQVLNVVKKRQSEVVHHPVAGVLHDELLQKIKTKIEEDDQQEDTTDPANTHQIILSQNGYIFRFESG